MKRNYISLLIIILLCAFGFNSFAQEKNRGKFEEPKPGFYQEIKKGIDEFNSKPKEERKYFKMDFEGIDVPESVDEFSYYWYNDPVSQGQTGTCWCFAATSFYESEMKRLHDKEIKLSEIFTVYHEYLEKALEFIRTRGESYFGQGAETNSVARMWKKYGAVPESVYNGMKEGQKFHDHTKMFGEMRTYLKGLEESNAWNEEEALNTIKSIMNHYMGKPPAEFVYEGKTYTPKTFLNDVMEINPDDYVDFMSLMEKPYYKQVDYDVPDNWWNSDVYYNVPLDDFMSIIKTAIRNGYTIAIGGDVSEAGYNAEYEAAVVPTFDIPSEYIDENSRQFRFSNRTTTDDHAIHLVGYKEDNGRDWFLIKDSGAGSRNGNNKGFYFYNEDYVKLKIMSFTIHKDAVKDILSKFK